MANLWDETIGRIDWSNPLDLVALAGLTSGNATAELGGAGLAGYLYGNAAAGDTSGETSTGSTSGSYGGGGYEEAPTSEESLSDILSTYLQYSPEFAAQNWGLLSQYAPQEAQLGYDIYSQYAPQYQDIAEALATSERSANMADVLALAPMLQQIQAAGESPEVTTMRDTLMSQIASELGMGTQMTAEQELAANEALRTAESARGLITGQGSANRESVAKALEGMDLQTQRQQKALQLVGAMGQPLADPFAAILGTSGTTSQAASRAQQTTPQSQVASSVPSSNFYSQNYWQANTAANEANKYNLGLDIALASDYLQGYNPLSP